MTELETCISFRIGKATQQVSRRARELLAPFGVTPGQYAVLKCLSESDGISGAELGSRLVLDSASVTGLVDRLVALGCVERRPDPDDRRVQHLHLSPSSRSRQAELDRVIDQLNQEAAAILGHATASFIWQLRDIGDRENWNSDV